MLDIPRPAALRYTLDGTDHTRYQERAGMIRRYIIWRNNHAYDECLRRIIDRAYVARCGTSRAVSGLRLALPGAGERGTFGWKNVAARSKVSPDGVAC